MDDIDPFTVFVTEQNIIFEYARKAYEIERRFKRKLHWLNWMRNTSLTKAYVMGLVDDTVEIVQDE